MAVKLDLKGSGTVDLELVDATGKQVATATAKGSGTVTMNVENPNKWSAETPYLYTLRASMQGSNEVIPVNVGFRKIELKGGQILVNGKAVLFKGADRHELDPDGGYVVSPERMLPGHSNHETIQSERCAYLPLPGQQPVVRPL